MVHNELNQPSLNNPQAVCTHCGKNATIHLTLLADASHQGESVCLSCAEVLIHDLQKPQSVMDDIEHGTIYWEGHGWSSDGPFAGA
jgi:hypothetical protein